MPIALDDVFVKETKAAVADAHGVVRPLVDILAVKEIILEFLFRDQVGLFAGELNEHSYRTGIRPLRGLALPIELQGLGDSCIPWGL
jgi:hypothetical protein